MSPTPAQTRRFAGLAGLSGALLFFAGDMFFYGHLGPAANFHQGMIEVVAHASLTRLFTGGLVGPVAACLCILGFWHVYLNVRPAQKRIGQIMLAAFFVLMVFGSAVHTLWTTRGLAIRYCYGNDDVGCRATLQAVNSYWDLAYNLGAVPGYVGAIILVALVLLGKTNYPRWTALANPAALLLLSPLVDRTPAPFGAILSGGFTNLSIATFFLVSVCTTWTHADDAGDFQAPGARHNLAQPVRAG
jgi:energy-coupling factor transporter transmembrane protein EcfT